MHGRCERGAGDDHGIVLNVPKEELPEARRSRFWGFALGAAVYSPLRLVA